MLHHHARPAPDRGIYLEAGISTLPRRQGSSELGDVARREARETLQAQFYPPTPPAHLHPFGPSAGGGSDVRKFERTKQDQGPRHQGRQPASSTAARQRGGDPRTCRRYGIIGRGVAVAVAVADAWQLQRSVAWRRGAAGCGQSRQRGGNMSFLARVACLSSAIS